MSWPWGLTGCTVDIRAYMGCSTNESYLKVISSVKVWKVGEHGAGRSGEIPAVIRLSCSTVCSCAFSSESWLGVEGIHLCSPLEPLHLRCRTAVRRPELSQPAGSGSAEARLVRGSWGWILSLCSRWLLTVRKRKTSAGCRMVLWTAFKGRVVQPCK